MQHGRNMGGTHARDADSVTTAAVSITTDELGCPDVQRLLAAHLDDMRATSPPESIHALDIADLGSPDVTFWTTRGEDGGLLGCAALKYLDDQHGEIKSMRTASSARGRGIASQLLRHLIVAAHSRGYVRLSLETGTQSFFEPARRLYARHGFTECDPFAGYRLDPNSVFMTLQL